MKIPLCESLKVATSVVNKINLPTKIAKECHVESWSNCREQGLCIKRFDIDIKIAVVSQARNSDEILVVCGCSKGFNVQTNQPSEELWASNAKRYFDQESKAAKHITSFLIS